jgi:2-succinyl-5-enolpyruvyl-6-hydroxy-3-cyclohexene-1-carboxylate synthase
MPFTHSVERDSYFNCYSIIDERSAGYFALGMIQQLHKPVAVCCTSGTATCNIISAANEAKFQRLPLLILTADRPEYMLDQFPDQMAPTHELYSAVCKKSVALPQMHDAFDEWRCMITINQALSELYHNHPGPVNINFQVKENEVFSFNTPELPKARRINRITTKSSEDVWSEKAEKLRQADKILIMCGQHEPFNEKEKEIIDKFSKNYNCVFISDHISNFHSDSGLKSSKTLALAAPDSIRKLVPNILITFAGHTLSGISLLMNESTPDVEHWLINENGEFIDTYRRLTNIFECSIYEFFKYFTDNARNSTNEGKYLKQWKELEVKFSIPDFEYSDIFAVQQLMKNIPENSLLHIANSISIRYSQFFDIPDTVRVYCNRGSNGIDGCLSTFIGASVISNQMSYLLIGDMSFFYDMTGLWNRYIGNNIRILLNNNSCGMLFNSNVYWAPYDGVNNFIAAEHDATAKGWCESRGFKYLSATNKDEFDKYFPIFMEKKLDAPILFEVFTDKYKNDKIFTDFYKKNKEITLERLGKAIINKIKR